MEPAATALIMTLLQVTGVDVYALWEKFMAWVVESLTAWLQDNLPKLPKFSENVLKLAFTGIKNASEKLLQTVKEAWKAIRSFLFGLTMNFQKEASSWVRVIRSKLIKLDDAGKQLTLVTEEVTEEIGFEDIPADVRKAIIRGAENNQEINIKEIRDRELLEMVT